MKLFFKHIIISLSLLLVMCGCSGSATDVDVFPLLVVTKVKEPGDSKSWPKYDYNINIMDEKGELTKVELPEELLHNRKIVTPFSNGVALVGDITNARNRCFVINTKGEVVFELNEKLGNDIRLSRFYTGFSEGIATVSDTDNRKAVAFNAAGEVLWQLEGVKIISPFVNGNAIYMMSEWPYSCGIIDAKGQIVLDAAEHHISSQSIGNPACLELKLFSVTDGEGYGVIDIEGNQILDCIYQEPIYIESRDQFVVLQDGAYGVVNKEGEEILPFDYDKLMIDGDMYLAKLKGEKEVVWVDKKGEIKINSALTEVSSIPLGGFHGTDYSLLDTNLIDKNGDTVLDKLGNVYARFAHAGHHYIVSCPFVRLGNESIYSIVDEEGTEFCSGQAIVSIAISCFVRRKSDLCLPHQNFYF